MLIHMITQINTVRDLNKFVDMAKITAPDKIISKLCDEGVIINHNLAKLLAVRDLDETHACSRQIF